MARCRVFFCFLFFSLKDKAVKGRGAHPQSERNGLPQLKIFFNNFSSGKAMKLLRQQGLLSAKKYVK